VSLAPEPALNALNSLALLNSVERMPALATWVTNTAAMLNPEQRRANHLLLDILGGALVTTGDWQDFPAYLADLAAQPPETLRDRAVRHLAGTGDDAPSPAVLLDNADAFAAYVMRQSAEAPPDTELLLEAHALLREPQRLRDMATAHLRAMWEEHLAVEWKRAVKQLDAEVKGFMHHVQTNAISTIENLRAFAGPELVDAVTTQRGPVQHIYFVPSPHTGRYVTRLYHDGTLWLFFHAPRNFAVLARQAPISRKELQLRLEALADETRLRLLELFAERDELTAQEIQEALELTQSTASRQLRSLALYLVERRGEGASKYYQLSPAQFDMTFRALKRLLNGAQESDQDARQEAGDLRRFMDRRGRLTMFPTKRRDQLLVLEYLAERFELGRMYTEREVNDVIARHLSYDDFVTIRRELFNWKFLGRERDGSRYWRINPAERATESAVL
jgi:DNA-binding transcriptional ArsR family regulator